VILLLDVTQRTKRGAPRARAQPTMLSANATPTPRRRAAPSTNMPTSVGPDVSERSGPGGEPGRHAYPSLLRFRDEGDMIATRRPGEGSLLPDVVGEGFLAGERRARKPLARREGREAGALASDATRQDVSAEFSRSCAAAQMRAGTTLK
jgi:hypothetical protein